ncbi:hypothetical protein [Microbacterium sp. Marseille-Q6965]|uniref:hypothetical protein n=1 Tax=Microbacterium sp. Marseille-Q6965 TaxID=2965072 RepID=UPI0021B807C7|nr:hypothetical protein [Microbacterium sp. Marseille-Q6965]
MSLAEQFPALPSRTAPRPQRHEEAPARRLRPVESTLPRRRPRMAYAVLAVGGAVAIAVAQMALSVLTTQDSYRVAELTQQQRELSLEAQALGDAVAGLSSPQYLAANAASLGMVVGGPPTYLRLSDAAIIGSGAAAEGSSSVSAQDPQIGNALLGDTPLVTDPGRSLQGAVPAEEHPAGATDESPAREAETPPAAPEIPPLTEGLPSPTTR